MKEKPETEKFDNAMSAYEYGNKKLLFPLTVTASYNFENKSHSKTFEILPGYDREKVQNILGALFKAGVVSQYIVHEGVDLDKVNAEEDQDETKSN